MLIVVRYIESGLVALSAFQSAHQAALKRTVDAFFCWIVHAFAHGLVWVPAISTIGMMIAAAAFAVLSVAYTGITILHLFFSLNYQGLLNNNPFQRFILTLEISWAVRSHSSKTICFRRKFKFRKWSQRVYGPTTIFLN